MNLKTKQNKIKQNKTMIVYNFLISSRAFSSIHQRSIGGGQILQLKVLKRLDNDLLFLHLVDFSRIRDEPFQPAAGGTRDDAGTAAAGTGHRTPSTQQPIEEDQRKEKSIYDHQGYLEHRFG